MEIIIAGRKNQAVADKLRPFLTNVEDVYFAKYETIIFADLQAWPTISATQWLLSNIAQSDNVEITIRYGQEG